MIHSVSSDFGANDSVDTLKVGIRPFDEPEGVCEKCDHIGVNSLNLVG